MRIFIPSLPSTTGLVLSFVTLVAVAGKQPHAVAQDCNGNGQYDYYDTGQFNGGPTYSLDCNLNFVPDECEIQDCNANSLNDACELRPYPILVTKQKLGTQALLGRSINDIVVRDGTGDGRSDIVAISSDPGLKLSIFAGLPDSSFETTPYQVILSDSAELGSSALFTRLDVADVLGTPLPDFVVSSRIGIFLIENLGGGSLGTPMQLLSGPAYGARIVDLNSDGLSDIVALVSGQTFIAVNNGQSTETAWMAQFINRGGSQFAPPEFMYAGQHSRDSYVNGGEVRVEDLDLDGDKDFVVVPEAYSNSAHIFLREDGSYRHAQQIPNSGEFISLFDLNSDALPDVLNVGTQGGAYRVALNLGGGLFEPQPRYAHAEFESHPLAIDLNHDAFIDLIGGSDDSPYFSLQVRSSSGYLDVDRTFLLDRPRENWEGALALAKGDIDGDGDDDIISGIWNEFPATVLDGLIHVIRNDTASPTAVDSNGDGVLDTCQASIALHPEADVNCDGMVDSRDLLELRAPAVWGSCNPLHACYDVNADGCITSGDFLMIRAPGTWQQPSGRGAGNCPVECIR